MVILLRRLILRGAGDKDSRIVPSNTHSKLSDSQCSGFRWDFGAWRLWACFYLTVLFPDTLDWTTSLSGKS